MSETTPKESLPEEVENIILFLLKDNAFDRQFLLTTIEEYILRNIALESAARVVEKDI